MGEKQNVVDKFKDFLKVVAAPEITLTSDRFASPEKEFIEGFEFGRKLSFTEGFEFAVEMIARQCIKEQKKLIFIGNGGSAAIASHQALDFFNKLKIDARVFNDGSFLTCMANDFGFENVFAKPLSIIAQEGDVLAAISSSGASPNIPKAVETARTKRCRVITMTGFKADNPLRKMGDINFYIPSSSYRIVEAAHSLYWDFILELLIDEEYRKIER